jgi:tRNA/rRNA methyltransferase
VITGIAQGRKGPARGGVLDADEAQRLRDLIAEHGAGRVPSERGPVRGLARLLRRNPTEAERVLWHALTTDRRFAGRGFKRQVPVGPHITDFVSFALRVVIDLVPPEESAEAARNRADMHAWLEAHDYRVVDVRAVQVEAGQADALDELASALGSPL